MRLQQDSNFTTLSWVKPELDETLRLARQALEDHVENGVGRGQMQVCAAQLHQVQGTLRMVELYGAAMVAEEMEQLANALLGDGVSNRDEAYGALMRSIMQLPDYLERLQSGHKDIPMVLLPLLNDLRGARGEKVVPESVLFSVDLGRPLPASVGIASAALTAAQLHNEVEPLREAFQAGLLPWLRDEERPDNIAALRDACSKLVALASVDPARKLFWIAAGILDALQSGAFVASKPLKQALAKLEREIKRLADEGETAFAAAPPTELTRQLLYYVASAATDDARIVAIRDAFGLDRDQLDEAELAHARGSLTGHNRELLDTVSAGIKEDLLRVKEALDMHLRTSGAPVADLAPQAEALGAIADTLGMLGLGVPRKVVQDQRAAIQALSSGERIADESALMDIAGSLLYVEASLDDQVARLGQPADGQGQDAAAMPLRESQEALDALIKESVANFVQARQCFVAFIEAGWDHAQLNDVPRLLDEVSGAMHLLEQERAARQLHALSVFTQMELVQLQRVPDAAQMDRLADALASLEYYLEALRDHRPQRDRILELAEHGLVALGYWPVPASAEQAIADAARPKTASVAVPAPSVEQAAPPAEVHETPAVADAASVETAEGVAAAEVTDEPAPVVIEAGSAVVPAPAPVAASGINYGFADSTEIDDDIREVFIEELDEEGGNLNELFAQWSAAPAETDVLRPLRRVFHTLKGSGRLVGALELGEFSWHIESLLNRVLDGSRPASPAVVALVGQAAETLPQFRAALMGNGTVTADIEGLKVHADRVAAGEEVFYVPAVPAPAVVEPVVAEPIAAAPVEATPVEAETPVESETSVYEAVQAAETPTLEEAPAVPDGAYASVDPVLLEILRAEVGTHLQTIQQWNATSAASAQPATDALLRAVHTISGAFAMTEVPLITDVLSPTEGYIRRLLAERELPSDDGVVLLRDVAHAIDGVLNVLLQPQPLIAPQAELAGRAVALRDALPEPTTPTLPVHLEEYEEEDFSAAPVDTNAALEAERIAAEQADAERAAAEHVEAERVAAEQAETERIASEQAEAEYAEAEHVEAERVAAERAEAERAAAEHAEAERIAAEQAEAERDAADQAEAERLAAEKAEAERVEYEKLEAEYAEADRLAVEQHAEAERAAAEPTDAVPVAVEQAEPLAAESVEPEYAAAEQEAERAAAGHAEAERIAAEYAETERAAAEQEAERAAAEYAEAERVAAEHAEAERAAAEYAEAERVAAEHAEADRAAAEYAEAERVAAEHAEAERVAAEHAEAERAAAEHAEVERVAAEHAEAERVAAEHAEAERVAAEHAEAERIAAEQAEADRIAVEKELIQSAVAGQDESVLIARNKVESARAAFEQVEAARVSADKRRAGKAAKKAAAQAVAAAKAAVESAEAELADAERAAAERVAVEQAEAEHAASERAATEALGAEVAHAAQEAVVEPSAEEEAAREESAAAQPAKSSSAYLPSTVEADPDEPLDLTDIDPELLDIFIEETTDILDHCDGLLTRLREAPSEREPVVGLQRDLHTLKGGARMSGMMSMGELAHAMESLLEGAAELRLELGAHALGMLEHGFDRLHGMLARVQQRQAVALPEQLIVEFTALARGELVRTPAPAPVETPVPSEAAESAETPAATVPAEAAEPSAAAQDIQPAEAQPERAKHVLKPLSVPVEAAFDEDDDIGVRAPQEQVRIRADLLDRLVNYAGEVAIYRARLEQQLGTFRTHLDELDQTTTRLRTQLRKLEIETEAQISARYQRAGEGEESFDPLELDRFSTQQQLTRALAESAADMTSLHVSLDDVTRQYETLLLQQSRVSSELQDGLMRTRMVPFDALVPRLRRVVRQTASETGKQIQLKVEGAQGEMDRNVLDRMTAPLEHMLRNAVVHGLETPQARRDAGKPEEGTVTVSMHREGSEVVMLVSDDGRGLDRDAIRRKAIDRGLLKADAEVSDSALYAFILESGFSTADTVSRLAGRGVGMDVVHNEIRQLGGSLQLSSTAGKGSQFTIRLPFTLAVTQAALVKIGETSFAVPISSVQGVGRIARADLEKQLASETPVYVYAGEEYAIHDLGRLLGGAPAKAQGSLQMPLLLSRSGDVRAAICVDEVLGSREIVVKPVGPQVSSIPGIFGATIMGDGGVMVILDVVPLVRRAAVHVEPEDRIVEVQQEVRRIPLVMVVDDSITMRKVTGRVLERNNMEVLAAKDGVDAIEKMVDLVPDLMLLDIEMPRMDGYELATHMRNDPRLRDVPIVMITSRTGEKHRQRAFEIGVNRYLGKPYQEVELMRNVFELLAPVHNDG